MICIIAAMAMMLSCVNQWGDYDADIKLTLTELTLDAEGDGSQGLTYVQSDHHWAIEYIEDWLSASVSEGEAGETRVKVKAAENESHEQRKGYVVFRSGNSRAQLNVTQNQAHVTMTPDEVEDYSKIYIPSDQKNAYLRSQDNWYFGRSRQSEHFILFWEPGYGEYGDTTPSDAKSAFYKVDVDELLAWAEQCYAKYIDILHFTDRGSSQLDKYKFTIYLHYSKTWAAYGWGLDNVAGCLWLNSDAAHYPETIAHEIGHSFSYQVYCDQLLAGQPDNSKRAYRYDRGEKGTGFWEQTAQWMSFRMCPDIVFSNYNFDNYCKNAHRHFLHEDMRYASYFMHYFWTDKHGDDAVAQLWRNSVSPEDALETYQRIHELSTAQLNAELYEYAARCITFDFNGLAEEGLKYSSKLAWGKVAEEDGWYRVSKNRCPEATGFNSIRIYGPQPGSEISLELEGLPNFEGYNASGDASVGGWTFGFVSISSDGVRSYSPSVLATTGEVATNAWEIPADCATLYAVVASTPVEYITHKWDENNSNDRHWPYHVRLTGGRL